MYQKKWIRNWWCTDCLIGQKGSFERESCREKGGEEWLRMLSMKNKAYDVEL